MWYILTLKKKKTDNQKTILTKEPKTTEKKPESYVLALEQYIRLVVMN